MPAPSRPDAQRYQFTGPRPFEDSVRPDLGLERVISLRREAHGAAPFLLQDAVLRPVAE